MISTEKSPAVDMPALMRAAVAGGIKELLSDKETVNEVVNVFWSAAFAQLQVQASEKTGRWVLGGVRAVASKMLMFIGLGMLVYSFGGWAAVIKFWHALWSSS